MPEKKESPLDQEVIKAIMGRKNYIEIHVRDAKGKVICTVKAGVDVLQYKFSWGWNRFLVKPLSGDKAIWKHWEHLKTYTDERELLSS